LVDKGTPPGIRNGFHEKSEDSSIYWTGIFDLEINQTEPGWLDEAQAVRACGVSTVKIAVGVAMTRGSLSESKGLIIREWMAKKISLYSGSSADSWKADLNGGFREAYQLASTNQFGFSGLTSVLLKDGSPSERLECVDLVYSILGVDGSINAGELSLAKKIASALEIDPDELQRISDTKLVNARAEVGSEDDLEQILGIDKTWDTEKVKRHLRDQFQKWNNRQTSLKDPTERENAVRMLALIAEARKKYS
jgi:hypothetical protein